jgi:hypothetical protein
MEDNLTTRLIFPPVPTSLTLDVALSMLQSISRLITGSEFKASISSNII